MSEVFDLEIKLSTGTDMSNRTSKPLTFTYTVRGCTDDKYTRYNNTIGCTSKMYICRTQKSEVQ